MRETEWGSEQAIWLGELGSRIFVMAHVPSKVPTGVVLVCSSLFTDTIFNYRREVELSRILAAAGLVVARFHFRGTGHSEGDPLSTTFNTMVDDALAVGNYLTSIGSGASPGLLGSRWGALVAAGVAKSFPDAPIAVWEPVLEGKSYVREALQASGVAHMASRVEGLSPKESLASHGVANVLGFPMGRALFDSAQELGLVDILGQAPRSVLYVGPKKAGGLPQSHIEAVTSLTSSAFEVSVRMIEGPKVWWFVDEINPTPLDAAFETAVWFEETLSGAKERAR